MLIDPRDKSAAIVGKTYHGGDRGYLRTPGAAEYLGLGQSTLEKMRHRGEGPKFRILGAKVVTYAMADLDDWAAQSVLTATRAA